MREVDIYERNQKKYRKALKKIDERIKFEATEFLDSLCKQPFRFRFRFAWRVLLGKSPN